MRYNRRPGALERYGLVYLAIGTIFRMAECGRLEVSKASHN